MGVGLATWSVVTSDDPAPSFEAPIPSTATSRVEPGGAALALQRLERAIKDDKPELAAGLAGSAAGVEDLLSSLVTNAAAAAITDVSLRYVDELGAVGADGAWPAAVAVEWRYAGFDRAPARTETVVRFAPVAGEVQIAGIGGDTLRTPVWMTGPLAVSHTEDLLVLAADADTLGRFARLAERAVSVVSRVLTDWDPRLVVEVPRDREALERALDVESGYYQQIAAVTGSADGSIEQDAPVHVYVNPEVFGGLGIRGQEVVLDHETAHVAGDGPTSRAPTWLVEGFADYVALRDSTLPLSKTAAQIREQVRSDGPPSALPGPAEFDTRGPHLGAVYESAWLACRVLAERGGGAAFIDFYRNISGGSSLVRELRREFDWSQGDLVRAWQSELENLPR
ncbi:hypothetical protein BH09ACT12_BH09ACT12_03970 [soil metagenome]